MSNELKKIVKKIQFRTDKTIEEIAKDIGYARAYFTNQVNIGTNKTLKALLEKYLLDNEQNVTSVSEPETTYVVPQIANELAELNTALPLGDLKLTVKDYIELWKMFYSKEEEKNKELITIIKDLAKGQNEIKDTLKPIATSLKEIPPVLDVIVRNSNEHDREIMKALDRLEGNAPGTLQKEAGKRILKSAVEHQRKDK